MTHPNSLLLEAFACGEPSATVEGHLAECSACRSFVDGLRGALAGGPSREQISRAVARAGERRTPSPRRKSDLREVVPRANLHAAPAPSRWVLRGGSVAIPLAMAAAFLFFLRTPAPPPVAEKSPPTIEPIALAEPPADPTTSFKGAIQIAAIRDRAGQQTRFSGHVGVKPGDRLRIEVALDREQTILAAVMGDDASWLELMPEGARSAGTHFSDRSARVDASPLRGTILVGSPAAMKHARETKDLSGLTSMRVEWEAP